MHLLLGQLVYTSFAEMGFRLLNSAQVPTEIQQAFIERVASQYWDSYKSQKSGYRAVYLHQVTPEHSLFGWLYNDGADDIGHSDVPYFICYHLAGSLNAVQLENIFTCLHKGPLTLIDRHNLPAMLENIVLRNLWSYQPSRPGVAVALGMRKHSHIALNQGELLDLLVSTDKQQMAIKLNRQTVQQKVHLSSYAHYLVKSIVTSAVALNKDAAAIEAKNLAPVKASSEAVAVNEFDIRSLIKNSQLLLGIGIAATILGLIGSIYVLLPTSIFAPSKPDIPSANSSVFFY